MRNLSPINENEDVVTREYVDTAVSGIASDVSDIKTAVGSDSDTESSSGTTLFAKLKYVVTSIGTLLTRITDARMTKIDSIGESSDTGTTTIFGKLNNMGGGSANAHYVWSGEVKSFTTQSSISITNTGSSAAEKGYVKKIGSFSFANGSAPNFFVNLATSDMVYTATPNVSSSQSQVDLFISTTNYTSTALSARTSLMSNYVIHSSMQGGQGLREEFVLWNSKDLAPNTTYYVYIALYDKALPASTGALKIKTPKIYLQSCYKTSTTTNQTGVKKAIVGHTRIIDNSYALTPGYQTKHCIELGENITSFLNCVVNGQIRYDYAGIFPVIAGPLIYFLTTAGNTTVMVTSAVNIYVGNSAIIEEYY